MGIIYDALSELSLFVYKFAWFYHAVKYLALSGLI